MNGEVWMLTTYPLWYRDGYATRVNSEIEMLKERGRRVGIVCVMPFSGRTDPARSDWLRRMETEGVPVEEIVKLPDRGSRIARRLADAMLTRRLRTVVRRRGIRLVHAQGLRAAGLTRLLPSEVKVVVDIHGDPEAEARTAAGEQPSPRWPVVIEWAREDVQRGLGRADGRIVVSHAMDEWAARRDARPAPTALVPCAVDVAMFRSRTERAPRSRPRICYLGGLQPYQSATIVAEAAARVAAACGDVDFWVITPTDHDAVRAAFRECGLAVDVEAMDRATIGERLGEADAGMVPRRDDPTNTVACPTKIGEYLAAGVPVLISESLGRWPELLRADGVGTSIEAPPEELRAFLADVMARRVEYGERARAAAESRWSWDQAIESVERLYEQLWADA